MSVYTDVLGHLFHVFGMDDYRYWCLFSLNLKKISYINFFSSENNPELIRIHDFFYHLGLKNLK